MTTFSKRPIGYKLGVVGLFLVTVVFIVGFAAPYWYENHLALDSTWEDGPVSSSGHQGLWVLCLSEYAYDNGNIYDKGCSSISKSSYRTIREYYSLVCVLLSWLLTVLLFSSRVVIVLVLVVAPLLLPLLSRRRLCLLLLVFCLFFYTQTSRYAADRYV